MRRRHDECYVLETRELGEADLIVTLLAQSQGKIRGVAPAARRSRRRFGGVLEPLTLVRASWIEREGRELHRLESAECLRSFATMQGTPELQATCAVLAEVTRTFGHEGQADPTGFRLLGAVLEALEGGGDPWSLIRYFEYWVLRVHGLAPDLSACAACGVALGTSAKVWVLAGSGLRCSACRREPAARQARWTAADRAALETFARVPPTELPTISGAGRGGSLELLLRGTLEAFAERGFHSYRHLDSRTAFPSGGVR